MSAEVPPTDLEWVQLRKDIGEANMGETSREKLIRKVTENPLVPIGCLATAGALTYGLWSFRQGRRKMSQTMMRVRIIAQGLTIAALLTGVMFTTGRNLK